MLKGLYKKEKERPLKDDLFCLLYYMLFTILWMYDYKGVFAYPDKPNIYNYT